MVAGVGLFGLFSGFIASWLLGDNPETDQEDLTSIATKLDRIEQALAEIKIKQPLVFTLLRVETLLDLMYFFKQFSNQVLAFLFCLDFHFHKQSVSI